MTTHLSTGEVEEVDLYLQTPYAFRASIQSISLKKFKVLMILQIIRLDKLDAVVVWHAVNFL